MCTYIFSISSLIHYFAVPLSLSYPPQFIFVPSLRFALSPIFPLVPSLIHRSLSSYLYSFFSQICFPFLSLFPSSIVFPSITFSLIELILLPHLSQNLFLLPTSFSTSFLSYSTFESLISPPLISRIFPSWQFRARDT